VTHRADREGKALSASASPARRWPRCCVPKQRGDEHHDRSDPSLQKRSVNLGATSTSRLGPLVDRPRGLEIDAARPFDPRTTTAPAADRPRRRRLRRDHHPSVRHGCRFTTRASTVFEHPHPAPPVQLAWRPGVQSAQGRQARCYRPAGVRLAAGDALQPAIGDPPRASRSAITRGVAILGVMCGRPSHIDVRTPGSVVASSPADRPRPRPLPPGSSLRRYLVGRSAPPTRRSLLRCEAPAVSTSARRTR
jgi:hypothetical protein